MRVPVKVRIAGEAEEVGGRKKRKRASKRGGKRAAIREQRRANRGARRESRQDRKLERLQERGEELRPKSRPARGGRPSRQREEEAESAAPASPDRSGPARRFPGEGPRGPLRRPQRPQREQDDGQDVEQAPPEPDEAWDEEEDAELLDVEESDVEEPTPTEEEVGALTLRRPMAQVVRQGDLGVFAAAGREVVLIPLTKDSAIVSAWSREEVAAHGIAGLARVTVDVARLKLLGAESAVGEDAAGFVPLAVYLVSQGIKAVKKATQEAAPAEPVSVETEVGRRRPPKRRGAKPPPRRVGDSCGCDACRRGRRGQR